MQLMSQSSSMSRRTSQRMKSASRSLRISPPFLRAQLCIIRKQLIARTFQLLRSLIFLLTVSTPSLFQELRPDTRILISSPLERDRRESIHLSSMKSSQELLSQSRSSLKRSQRELLNTLSTTPWLLTERRSA